MGCQQWKVRLRVRRVLWVPGGAPGDHGWPGSPLTRPTLPQDCLDRSFKAQVFSCPACRYDLGRSYTMTVNQPLQAVLTQLFPGYGSGR